MYKLTVYTLEKDYDKNAYLKNECYECGVYEFDAKDHEKALIKAYFEIGENIDSDGGLMKIVDEFTNTTTYYHRSGWTGEYYWGNEAQIKKYLKDKFDMSLIKAR